MRAIRNIKKGEEVYNCYGPHFRRMSRQERQSSLLQQYMFLCKCEQCTSEEDFIERFTGYRCQNETCGGIVPIHGRICPKCLISLREDCVTSVEKAVAFMYSGNYNLFRFLKYTSFVKLGYVTFISITLPFNP